MLKQGPPRILLIEGELDIGENIVERLTECGYSVTWAKNGQNASRLLNESWNLILLDLMIPDMSGESLMSLIGTSVDYPAVMILSAEGTLSEKLNLFQRGCDDYLTKPLLFEELLARAQALLRRGVRGRPQLVQFQDLELFQDTNTLRGRAGSVLLTPKETALLRIFLREPGRVVSRKEILESVWGLTREHATVDYVGIHLFRLRKKLAQLEKTNWICTVKNSGYSFGPPSITERNSDQRIGA